MEYVYRKYTDSDYALCEELVNRAWNFDTVFRPKEMSEIAKTIYTRGSLTESNYHCIAELNGQVAGFIFGLNENARKPKLHLGLKLSILWNIFRIKQSTPDKKQLLTAMTEHEKSRSAHVSKRRSEIVLFVVGESHQGKGVGKHLWSGFLKDCQNSSVANIVVETNKKGASSFY